MSAPEIDFRDGPWHRLDCDGDCPGCVYPAPPPPPGAVTEGGVP